MSKKKMKNTASLSSYTVPINPHIISKYSSINYIYKFNLYRILSPWREGWSLDYCQKLSSLKRYGGLISTSGRPWLLLSGRQRITSPVNAILHFTRAEHLLHVRLTGSCSWQKTVSQCSWGTARAQGTRRKEPLPPHAPPRSASAKHIWDPVYGSHTYGNPSTYG